MATHSGILAWKSYGQRSLASYKFMRLQRMGHNSVTEHTYNTHPRILHESDNILERPLCTPVIVLVNDN